MIFYKLMRVIIILANVTMAIRVAKVPSGKRIPAKDLLFHIRSPLDYIWVYFWH